MKILVEPLSPVQILAAASETMKAGGYEQVTGHAPEWETPYSRLFEDAYSVVGIAVFDTCSQLLNGWPELQGSLVDTVSRYVARAESKSWDGYLILLTSSVSPSDYEALEALRYNTHRLRKIVATGEDLQTSTDVARALIPLLPLSIGELQMTDLSVLDVLPGILVKHGIPEKTTKALIDAFRKQEPLMDRLQKSGSGE